MNTIELRIALTEEILRELLWQALMPEALVITKALNDAIVQEQDAQGIALNEFTLSGISISTVADTMYAELSYTAAKTQLYD